MNNQGRNITEEDMTEENIQFGTITGDKNIRGLINKYIFTTKWQIWKARCENKYDSKEININKILRLIHANIEDAK